MTDARPHRAEGGFALARGHRATLATVSHPGIDWMTQDAAHAGGIPPCFARGRRELCVTEPFGDTLERAGHLRLGIPGKDLRDDRRFDGIKPQAVGVPRAFRVQQVPIGRHGPG